MRLLIRFIYERRAVYLMFVLLSGLVLLTFYLYRLNLAPFYDCLMFISLFLLFYSFCSFYGYYQKCKKLTVLTKSSLQPDMQLFLPKAETSAEQQYQQLLAKTMENQAQMIAENQERQKEILDDFGLWLHQIKTPVAALDLLVQSGEMSPLTMRTELFKINDYLQLMLNYLRQHLDNNDILIQQVAVEDVIKTVVKKYALFFSQKNIQLSLELSKETAFSDKKWLIFILEQFLSNSVKYTKNGRISIFFNEGTLTIKDTGIGIRKEDLPRIFEKGYTGYNGRAHQKASGLGLYLSQMVAQKLGCKLNITSTVGEGTTVTLVFPSQLELLE